jgi:hypothetical protein
MNADEGQGRSWLLVASQHAIPLQEHVGNACINKMECGIANQTRICENYSKFLLAKSPETAATWKV